MPKDLILNSLEIKRFRCFRELRIGHLGRVNLIVGKNNVGKSTILEALRLFAKPASIGDLREILASRNEILATETEDMSRNPTYPLPSQSLFFGRRAMPGEEGAISIGPADAPDEILKIGLGTKDRVVQGTRLRSADRDSMFFDEVVDILVLHRETALIFRIGSARQILLTGHTVSYDIPSTPDTEIRPSARTETLGTPLRTIPLYSVGPNGLRLHDIGRLWDNVSLTPLEKEIVEALHVISAEVDRLALKVPDDWSKVNSHRHDVETRIPFVKIETLDEPIPLRVLGDGMNRLFGLALALVHAKDGLLLVDEIENGIHYSVQTDLWRLVFKTAARLNVQVFATTHSYDCIKAFEEAARESEEEGVLVRLARKGDRTLVGEFDERELEIAVEGEIEVR